MPQNKPMKIQWITVNGRQVPLVLPQTYSYKDDDWKITSDQDPLPIVEYGTTAGGIVVPKRVSDDGHELTQLTGSNVELRLLDADLGGSPITVGQGLTYTIDNIDVKNYAKCYLGVLVENQTKWSMSLTFLNRAIYTAHTVQNITTINQKTDFVDVLSNSARITITNNGTTDMNIKRIYLFLSKMR